MYVILIDFLVAFDFGFRFVSFALLRFSLYLAFALALTCVLSLSLFHFLSLPLPLSDLYICIVKKFLSGSGWQRRAVKQCDGIGITLPSAESAA